MEEPLPTHLPDYEAWRAEVLRRIQAASATASLESLVQQHCDREALVFRLAGLAAEWFHSAPTLAAVGLTRHRVKFTPKILREAAEVMDSLRKLKFFRPPDELEAAHLSPLLRLFADRIEKDLPLLLRPSHTTIGVAALCGLIGYVKRTTHSYHDEEVSALVGAVLQKQSYAATHLTQWRAKHKAELALLGSCVVNPISIPVPTT